MGRCRPAAGRLPTQQVPGRDPPSDRAAADRLRAGADEGGGAQGYTASSRASWRTSPRSSARLPGFAFYNTSPYNFERLLGDAPHLAANLRSYINGFSDNMREVLEKFDFENTIAKLNESGLLFLVLERFKNIDLHPDQVSNLEMGYIFEELIRKFNEAMDENPGEHFTPREVIRLMVNLLLSRDKDTLAQNHIVRTVYDPCCGSGGMLTIAKDRILEMNPNAEVHLFGQEVNPETFAVCKSDLYLKSSDGRDAENIKFGSTLSHDQHAGSRFDYLLTNPPYGKEWKMDQAAVEAEAERGYAGRFGAGLPRISDGQLLFLQHLLCRMKDPKDGGSRVAIVMNGSPLFTGDAGSGESEIRRWILENDWLEAIVAMPEQLFYNTGIPTYVWVLTNRKPRNRKNKVQLIDATSFWVPMRKSLGDKRREISAEQIQQVTRIFESFKEGEHSKIFATEDFGYRKITVERPLRLNFQASPERIERLKQEKAFLNLATSKKKGKDQKKDIQAGEELQGCILSTLGQLGCQEGLEEPCRVREGVGQGVLRVGGQGSGCRPQGDPRCPFRTGRDRRHLHRRRGLPGSRSRTAGHRERAACRGCMPVLRAGGQAARPRRLGEHRHPRPQGQGGGQGRLRDQLQPLLLPCTSRRDRWRTSRRTSATWRRTSWQCCGRWRDEEQRHPAVEAIPGVQGFRDRVVRGDSRPLEGKAAEIRLPRQSIEVRNLGLFRRIQKCRSCRWNALARMAQPIFPG